MSGSSAPPGRNATILVSPAPGAKLQEPGELGAGATFRDSSWAGAVRGIVLPAMGYVVDQRHPTPVSLETLGQQTRHRAVATNCMDPEFRNAIREEDEVPDEGAPR